MKKTVEVIITKEIEVEISDDRLTPESISAFEQSFHSLDDDEAGEDKVERLFSYVATQVALHGTDTFVEGVGQSVPWHRKELLAVRCKETECEFETQIMQETAP